MHGSCFGTSSRGAVKFIDADFFPTSNCTKTNNINGPVFVEQYGGEYKCKQGFIGETYREETT